MRMQDDISRHEIKLALTRQEAAEALGLKPVTVDRLVKRGCLNQTAPQDGRCLQCGRSSDS